MLTYKNTNVNFIAFTVAESTNDDCEILSRMYENDVEVHYTINQDTNVVHLLYIESKDTQQGNATIVMKEFMEEFSNYNIIIDALFYLRDWYEKLGFKYEFAIEDMFSFRMSKRCCNES